MKKMKPDPSALDALFDAALDLIPCHKYNATSKKHGKVQKRGKSPRDYDWRKKQYKRRAIAANAEAGGNTGVRLGSGQLVLDVDPRNMKGEDVLARFCADFDLDLSKYPCVVTGSGGFHYYMSKPDDVLVKDSLKDYPGLEFKSQGRQVIAPGSIHPDTGIPYIADIFGPRLSRKLPAVPEDVLAVVRRPTVSTENGGGEYDAEQVSKLLACLDPEDFRDQGDWLTVMMACHHASGGDARQEFIDWSTLDPQYSDDAGLIGNRWDSLDPRAKGGVTYKTLNKLVADAGYADELPAQGDAEDDFESVGDDELDPDGPQEKHERLSPLEKMNRRFTATNDQGKFRVTEWCMDDDYSPPRRYLQRYAKWDLEMIMATTTMQTKDGKVVQVMPVWMEWSGRRTVKGIIFDPKGDRPGYTNLWQGWTVEPRKGDWSLFRQLIEENLCNASPEQYEYVLNWIAHMFQRPWLTAEVALVFPGKKGTGKGTLGKVIAAICGTHGMHISSSDHLTGRFNSHQRDCIFMFADESIPPHDQAANSRIKTLITEPTVTIEAKGKDIVTAKNLIHVIMATNDDYAAPVGLEDERRYFVADVNTGRMDDKPFFAALYKQMFEDGGLAAFLFDMLRRDITGWHPRDSIPVTPQAVRQKLLNMDPFTQFWYHLLMEGQLPFEPALDRGAGWDDIFPIRVFKQDVRDAFDAWLRKAGISTSGMGRGQEVTLVRKLKELAGPGFKTDLKTDVPEDRLELTTHGDGRAWTYEIPPLDVCRALMDEKLGGPGGWPVERKRKKKEED